MQKKCNKKNVANLVYNFMVSNAGREYNSKTVARLLHSNFPNVPFKNFYHHVRTTLSRLAKQKKLIKCHIGFYRKVVERDLLTEILKEEIVFHGIKIQLATITSPSLPFATFTHKNNGSKIYKEFWQERELTIILHKNLKVEIFLKANELPLTFVELLQFSEFLNGLFLGKFWQSSPILSQIGFSKDLKSVMLNGIKSIQFRDFLNSMQQIYQKSENKVRFERHWNGKIAFEKALDLLKNATI